jgi:Holliday junction DNA helicase RuvA
VAPGIGKRIAQRIILELKDKLSKEQSAGGWSLPGGGAPRRIRQQGHGGRRGASVLGYSTQEVTAALKGVDVEHSPLEEIIRQSLKKMVK